MQMKPGMFLSCLCCQEVQSNHLAIADAVL
jgi:hypothetical protein